MIPFRWRLWNFQRRSPVDAPQHPAIAVSHYVGEHRPARRRDRAMGTVPVHRLLQICSHRIKMNDAGLTKWSPQLRASVETLVGRLRNLSPDDLVAIDADADRDPIGRFILARTGEVLGEI